MGIPDCLEIRIPYICHKIIPADFELASIAHPRCLLARHNMGDARAS
jgi:hypothetical protein